MANMGSLAMSKALLTARFLTNNVFDVSIYHVDINVVFMDRHSVIPVHIQFVYANMYECIYEWWI